MPIDLFVQNMRLAFFTFTYLNIFLLSQYCHFIIIYPLIHFHFIFSIKTISFLNYY